MSAGIVVVSICLVFAFVMTAWHGDIGGTLGATGESITSAVAQQVDRDIEFLDLTIQSVADRWGDGEVQNLPPHLRDMVLFDTPLRAPGLGMVVVIDSHGRLAAESKNVLAPGTSVWDRAYFQVHLASPDAGLFISKPFVSRDTGRRIVALSRRISDRSGAFIGVVVGTIYLDYLAERYAGLQLGPDSAVSLLRTDGTVIARGPRPSETDHLRVGDAASFARMTSSRSGAFEGPSLIDGQPRIVTFHRVSDLPLIQVVEVGGQEIYAAWWRRAIAVSGLLGVLCLSVIGLCTALRRELAQRAAAEAALVHLAGTDPLTGLANRRRFDEALSTAWSTAVQQSRPMALLMVDADAFKRYNDLFGHQAGDDVLRRVATCLASRVSQQSGLVCRWGGEEFAIFLSGLDGPAAMTLADTLCSAVRALGIAHPDGVDGVVTISVGVASAEASGGGSIESLVAGADAALYRAKAEGRDRSSAAPSVRTASTIDARLPAPAQMGRPRPPRRHAIRVG